MLRYLFVVLVRQSRKRAHDGIYCTPENEHCHSVYSVVETMWDGEDRENVPDTRKRLLNVSVYCGTHLAAATRPKKKNVQQET